MITHVSRPQTRRVLMVDDELANPTTAGGRAVRALADELKARGIEVVEAYSCEDGTATVTSDSALHCVLVNWTLGNNDRRSHDQATELLRALRARNATIPVYLMADRRATDVTRRSGDAGRRVHLDARGHRDLRRRPGVGLDRAVPPDAAAAFRRGAGPLRPGAGVLLGGARPPGRRGVPQVAGRPGVLRLLRREPLPHRHGHRAGRAGLAAGSHRPGRRERAIRGPRLRRPSLLLGPQRHLGRPTGPSCRPAWATPRSRCATATATSPSSRGWC